MNLFDRLVEDALEHQPDLSGLRVVVEKELLHHDIMRVLSEHGFLEHLTFIGGTALRMCYQNIRLSEDLDFTGGPDFTKAKLANMGAVLTKYLEGKYGLAVQVKEPTLESGNVDTWKMQVQTRPQSKHMPRQRIHIDVCAVPSYDTRKQVLINHYGVDVGTHGLMVWVQSREEIFIDKIIAFALRPNRVKYRDLWDIAWLHQNAVIPRFDLLVQKLLDRNRTLSAFEQLYAERLEGLQFSQEASSDFASEMYRFLPSGLVEKRFEDNGFLQGTLNLLKDFQGCIHTCG